MSKVGKKLNLSGPAIFAARRQALNSRNESNGASYKSSSIKRKRRTKAEMTRLRDAIYEICELRQPQTVRHLFYHMCVKKLIEKLDAEYTNVTVRLAGQMREDGELPWDWLVDETRTMRKPDSYGSLSDMLDESHQFYRRDLWAGQDVYLEVWCESDSVAGVIYDVTAEWDVPLMSARGFSSKSFCWNAAKTIEYHDKPAVILYVGDYDPAGLKIDRDIQNKLRRYAPDADLTFRRLAVNKDQIAEYDLPTRPPKDEEQAKKLKIKKTVEVEALDSRELRRIVSEAIESYIDFETLERLKTVEQAERDTLANMIEALEE